jgi:hypothetical protein
MVQAIRHVSLLGMDKITLETECLLLKNVVLAMLWTCRRMVRSLELRNSLLISSDSCNVDSIPWECKLVVPPFTIIRCFMLFESACI